MDEMQGCEDVAINFLATHLSGLPPLLVFDPVHRPTELVPVDVDRSACLNRLSSMFGYLPLKTTSETVFPLELAPSAWEQGRLAKLARRRKSGKAKHRMGRS